MPACRLSAAVFALLLSPLVAPAAVVSFLNATDREMNFTIEHKGAAPVGVSLAPGEARAVPVGREPVLRITLNGKPAAFTLEPYTPYLFVEPQGKPIEFSGVELAGELPKPDDVPAAPEAAKPLKVPVKLFHDDAQPLTKAAWEKAAKERFTEAADVLFKQTGVRFEADGIGEWFAAKDSADLPAALADFELKAEVKAGTKAVGFRTRAVPGDGFGAAGEPGCSHLLVREASPKADGERVEVVAHHLGLMLGAVRSPDRGSVMRLKLGDGQAAKKGYRVQFDPLNLIVMNVWAEEVAAGSGKNFHTLRATSRERLRVLYKTLAGVHEAMKTDDTQAREYVEWCEKAGPKKPDAGVKPTPPEKPMATDPDPTPKPADPKPAISTDAAAVRVVVQAVTAKAKELAKKPATGEGARPKGDSLTAEYVRAAAEAALKLDEKKQPHGFLVGLGIALDDSTILRDKPVVKALCEAAESDAERKERLAALGLPTVRGRRDLCQHFAVSAALTELFGAAAAEFAGLSKEMADMKGVSGFSFADLAADLAGVEFAAAVGKEPKRLAAIAKGFAVSDHAPDVKEFADGLSEERFKKEYGGVSDKRFVLALERVRAAVKDLPAYKK